MEVGENKIVADLDKSFCEDKNDDKNFIAELESGSGSCPFFKEDANYESEIGNSGCLLPNEKRFTELNLSSPYSIEYINIFDSTDVKYKSIPCFFRRLTKSKCEISKEEEKLICEKILMYYKKATMRLKDPDKYTLLEEDEKANFNSNINTITNNNICQGICDNNFNSAILDEDSLINDLNLERMLSTNSNVSGTEVKMFERNKQIFTNLNPTNFNILVAGERNSGKTNFIRMFCAKMKSSLNLEEFLNETLMACDADHPSFDSKINSKPTVTFTTRRISYSKSNSSHSKLFEIKMIDSPGYNSNQTDHWLKEITNYINNKYRTFFNKKENDESGSKEDCRIHVCLYFCTKATEVDFENMKKIGDLVNLIPIIGRGDRLTKEEAINLKCRILDEGSNKYGVKFLELDHSLSVNIFKFTEQKICQDPRRTNSLLGGSLKFCPPYVLVSSNPNMDYKINCEKYAISNSLLRSFDMEYQEQIQDQDNDFSRLYFLLTSFIPFECIEKTKIYYKKIKNKLIREKLEESEFQCQNHPPVIRHILGLTGMFGSIYLLKSLQVEHNYNV